MRQKLRIFYYVYSQKPFIYDTTTSIPPVMSVKRIDLNRVLKIASPVQLLSVPNQQKVSLPKTRPRHK